MPLFNASRMNDALKVNHIFDSLAEQVFTTDFNLQNIQRMTGEIRRGGRSMVFSLKTRKNPSFRGSRVGEMIASPGNPAYEEAELTMTRVSASCEFEIEAEEVSVSEADGFIKAVTELMSDTVSGFRSKLSKLMWSNGTGAVARVNGAPAANVVTLHAEGTANANGTYGSRLLYPGQEISASANITSGNYEAERAFSTTISSIDSATQITVADDLDLANNDYIFWGPKDRTSKNRMPDGFEKIFDDGTNYATLHGLDRTAAGNAYWKGNLYDNWGTADLEEGFQDADINIRRRTEGARSINVIQCDDDVQKLFFQQTGIPNRMALVPVSSMSTGPKFVGGYGAVSMALGDRTVPIIAHTEVPRGTAWCIDWSTLFLGYRTMPKWLDKGEGVWKWLTDYFAYRAVFYATLNLGCKLPMANAVFKKIG